MEMSKSHTEGPDVVLVVLMPPGHLPAKARFWCEADHYHPDPIGATALIRGLPDVRRAGVDSAERLVFRGDRLWTATIEGSPISRMALETAFAWVDASLEVAEWHFFSTRDFVDEAIDEAVKVQPGLRAWWWPRGWTYWVIGKSDRPPKLPFDGLSPAHEIQFCIQGYSERQTGVLGQEIGGIPPDWGDPRESDSDEVTSVGPKALIWQAGDEERECEWVAVTHPKGVHFPLERIATEAPVVVVRGSWEEAEEFRGSGVPMDRVVHTMNFDLNALPIAPASMP
jgi:hypothetical protein